MNGAKANCWPAPAGLCSNAEFCVQKLRPKMHSNLAIRLHKTKIPFPHLRERGHGLLGPFIAPMPQNFPLRQIWHRPQGTQLFSREHRSSAAGVASKCGKIFRPFGRVHRTHFLGPILSKWSGRNGEVMFANDEARAYLLGL